MNPTAPVTAPQPGVPLSPQQVQAIRTQVGIKSVSSGSSSGGSDWSWLGSSTKPTPTAKTPSTIDKMSSDLSDAASNAEDTINSQKTNSKGQTSLGNEINTGLQVGGDVAGGVVGAVGELPGIKQAGEAIGAAGKGISDTLMQNPEYADMFTKAAGLEDAHPTITKDLGAVANIGNAALLQEGGNKVTEAAGAAKETASDAASNAADSVKQSVKNVPGAVKGAISPIRTALTKLPNEVSSTLKEGTNPEEMKSQLQTALSEGKKSLSSGGKSLDPYELAGRTYLNKAVDTLKSNMANAGSKIEQHLSEFADTPVDVSDTFDKLHNLAASRLGTVFNGVQNVGELAGKTFTESLQKLTDMMESGKNDPAMEGLLGNAENRTSLVTKASDKGLLGKTFSVIQDMQENGTTAQKLSDTIKSLNDDLDHVKSSRPSPTNTPTEGVVKNVVHELTTKLDSLGQKADGTNPYKDAKTAYGKAASLAGDLNKRLGGKIGQDYKNASSMMIRRLSPQDGGTRAALRSLEEQTGVPVFQHAVIAKFAMDVLKDSRVRSVLENIKNTHPSSGGIMRTVWHTITNAIGDPEGKAMKILDNRIGSKGTKAIYSAVKDALPQNEDITNQQGS